VNRAEGTRHTEGGEDQGQHDARNQDRNRHNEGAATPGRFWVLILGLAHELWKADHRILRLTLMHESRRRCG
jgi:hypothetical protein